MFGSGSDSDVSKKTEVDTEALEQTVATLVIRDEKTDEGLYAKSSYETVCKEMLGEDVKFLYQDDEKKFIATYFPSASYIEYTITLPPTKEDVTPKNEVSKVGFKIYVAVDDSNGDPGKNVAKFWDILTKYLLDTKCPMHMKGVIPGKELSTTNKDECGKQFVLYYFLNPELNWQKILTELTEKMVEAGIKPAPQSPNTIAVGGSNFFSLGQDTAPNSGKKGRKAYVHAEARGQIPMGELPKNLQIVIEVAGQPKKPTAADLAVSSPTVEEPKTTVPANSLPKQGK